MRDEGRAYAARLIESGNDVAYLESKGAVHGLWVMNAITPAAAELIGEVAGWIRRRWREEALEHSRTHGTLSRILLE